MSMATKLAAKLSKEGNISVWAMPKKGVTVFRPLSISTQQLYERLLDGMLSICNLDNQHWLRSVTANPLAGMDKIICAILEAVP